MKKILYLIVVCFLFACGEIHKENRIKSLSYELSVDSLYDSAATYYHLALDSLHLKDDALRYNQLSNKYYLNDTLIKQLYLELINDSTFQNNTLKSKAFQQLGILEILKLDIQNKTAEELKSMQLDKNVLNLAMDYTANALRFDYTNEEARSNLELLYMIQLQDQNQQNQDQQNQDKDQQQNEENQQNQDQNQEGQQDQNKQNKEGSEGENSKNQKEKGKDGKEDQGKENGKEEKQNSEGKNDKKSDKGKEQQNKDAEAEKSDQQKGEEKGGNSLQEQQEKQKAEQEKIINQRLQEQGLSKEQMDQLLRSLNEQNKKYIQQIQKDPNPNNSNDGKPDW